MPTDTEKEQVRVVYAEPEFRMPSLWKVFILNDDVTPMDFVVKVLVLIFGKEHDEALELMYEAHKTGQAQVGTYSKDVAETKIFEVTELAGENGYPLRMKMEK